MSSTVILLTFLGAGNYQPCRYAIEDSVSDEETFFSIALARQITPTRIICLQTEFSAEKHGPTFSERCNECNIPLQPVLIPDGRNEDELWAIFSALTTHIPEGCTLHLDITHGFRSLPLLGFIALSYLRTTRQINIGGLHYGAWEARDGDNPAPAFDLTPFLTLLDWSAAADQFLATGNANRLADMLQSVQRNLWVNSSATPEPNLPTRLSSLGSTLQRASANLTLLRTGAFAKTSKSLKKLLQAAESEAVEHASPFLEVIEPVRRELTRFHDTDLATLRELVGWLAERGQVAPSLTLASEWLISYIMIALGENEHHANHATRKPFAITLSLLERNESLDNADPEAVRRIEALRDKLGEPTLNHLAATSSRIRSARNDLNHGGFQEHPASAVGLCEHSIDFARSLATFPLPPGPMPDPFQAAGSPSSD